MFIDDLWGVMRRTHSFRALILGLLGLFVPEILYATFGIEPDPYLRFQLVALAIAYGVVGRLIKQENERYHWLSVLVLVIAGFLVWQAWQPGLPPDVTAVVKVEEQAAIAEPVIGAEAAFLEIAVPLAAKWEGLRLVAYLDPVGVLTVCYGETKGVKPGDSYTKAECDEMLGRRLLEFRTGLHRYFTRETIADRLPPTRDAAYGSFAYNVGVSGAGGSTAIKRLNAGNIAGGCEALTWWNKAGGRVFLGLTRRRAEERDLCLEGVA
ncbi:MAG: lysozyme [Pelagimonas sp.]|uniref:lysozyme n=1 Tax=Pelagimonas sp. TaxID=2073170 RepID=UPI003D6AA4DC